MSFRDWFGNWYSAYMAEIIFGAMAIAVIYKGYQRWRYAKAEKENP